MAITVIVDPNDYESVVHVLGVLNNKRELLEGIGALMVGVSQRAFDEQQYGDTPWPQRYPNQNPPFLNVAGAIADFAGGRNAPKARRFNPRPALRDTSNLMHSIAYEVQGRDTVEVGTPVPYASIHQFGGVSRQPVDKGTKKRIAKWLLKDEGKPYRDKLLPALKPNLTMWDTEVNRRPFLGVTEQLADDIREAVVTHLEEGLGGVNP